MPIKVSAASCIALLVLSGCSSDGGTAPATIGFEKVAGDMQTGIAGAVAAVAPEVRVTRNGEGLGGVTVEFNVASGGGSVTGSTQVTGADGTATVGAWTFGPVAGTNTLEAHVQGQSSGGSVGALTFTATTTAVPAARPQETAARNQPGMVGAAVSTAPRQ